MNAAKLSVTEDFAAWTTGVTTGTVSSAFLLVLGPVVGYYAGRAVHRKKVVQVAKERLDREGEIRSALRRWNEQKFSARGFRAWLELPVDGGEIKVAATAEKKKPRKQRKAEKKISKRFRITIVPQWEAVEQTPSYSAPWGLASPVSVPMVEALGNEHRDPVELHNSSSPTALTDWPNSTLPRAEPGTAFEDGAARSANTFPLDGDGVGNRSELE